MKAVQVMVIFVCLFFVKTSWGYVLERKIFKKDEVISLVRISDYRLTGESFAPMPLEKMYQELKAEDKVEDDFEVILDSNHQFYFPPGKEIRVSDSVSFVRSRYQGVTLYALKIVINKLSKLRAVRQFPEHAGGATFVVLEGEYASDLRKALLFLNKDLSQDRNFISLNNFNASSDIVCHMSKKSCQVFHFFENFKRE